MRLVSLSEASIQPRTSRPKLPGEAGPLSTESVGAALAGRLPAAGCLPARPTAAPSAAPATASAARRACQICQTLEGSLAAVLKPILKPDTHFAAFFEICKKTN